MEQAELSPGQKLAVGDLRGIGAASGGDLAFDAGYANVDRDLLEVRVWLACDQIERSEGGVPLEDWEPVIIEIPEEYPISAPAARADHWNFAGQPHVLWGRNLCLYPPGSAWDPSAGMRGFLRRLMSFYECLASGTFEGPQVPWHPPVTYSDPWAGCVVMTADLSPADRLLPGAFLRWAVAVRLNEDRIDVAEWLGFPGLPDPAGDLASALAQELKEARERTGHSSAFLVPAVILPKPIAFEYPLLVSDLRSALESAGLESDVLPNRILCTRIANERLSSGDYTTERLWDTYLIVRAPADNRFSTADGPAHFAVWQIPPDDAAVLAMEASQTHPIELFMEWLDKGSISWAQVYDIRPEAVARRDAGRPVERLAECRVLVLGCGALGAPIAEHCVRAGAAAVDVIDWAVVHPGILVRQPYEDTDIGLPKASELARRLDRIRPATSVNGLVDDALNATLLRRPCPRYYDLVIDATANRAVATAIERSKRHHREHWPDLVTVAISQDARTGVAAVAPCTSYGAGIDLFRRLGLETTDRPDLREIHDQFFPPPAKQHLFVPEPGCSDTTFVGSATDVAALAAQLLDGALSSIPGIVRVSAAGEAVHYPRERTLCIAQLAHSGERQLARTRLQLAHDEVVADRNGIYEVRVDRRARLQMRRHVAEMAAIGPFVKSETGGLLLGQFDDACQIAWVTAVTGPSVGSLASPVLLQLNAPADREFVRRERERSEGCVDFVGFWHTHPDGRAVPSGPDMDTMTDLLEGAPGHAPRLVLMILAIPSEQGVPDFEPVDWQPEICAEVFTR